MAEWLWLAGVIQSYIFLQFGIAFKQIMPTNSASSLLCLDRKAFVINTQYMISLALWNCINSLSFELAQLLLHCLQLLVGIHLFSPSHRQNAAPCVTCLSSQLLFYT